MTGIFFKVMQGRGEGLGSGGDSVEFSKRKSIRLKDYDYSQNGAYFLTVCVKDRHELLGGIDVGDAVLSVPIVRLSDIGNMVNAYLANMSQIIEFAVLENYVIMPNHIHLLIVLNNEHGTLRTASPTISRIVHGLKTVTTKQIGHSIWQRGYHDHIIRNEDEYVKIWHYIDENPAKWKEDEYIIPNAYNEVNK